MNELKIFNVLGIIAGNVRTGGMREKDKCSC